MILYIISQLQVDHNISTYLPLEELDGGLNVGHGGWFQEWESDAWNNENTNSLHASQLMAQDIMAASSKPAIAASLVLSLSASFFGFTERLGTRLIAATCVLNNTTLMHVHVNCYIYCTRISYRMLKFCTDFISRNHEIACSAKYSWF